MYTGIPMSVWIINIPCGLLCTVIAEMLKTTLATDAVIGAMCSPNTPV